MKQAKEKLQILIDTREQKPLRFPADTVEVTRGTVPVFDYALIGDERGFSIERKSLEDFIQAVILSDSWRRERAKIEKAGERLLPIVYVLEASFADLAEFDYAIFTGGKVSPQFAYRRWAELSYDLGTHVVWAGDRQGAAYAVALLLKRRKEELARHA